MKIENRQRALREGTAKGKKKRNFFWKTKSKQGSEVWSYWCGFSPLSPYDSSSFPLELQFRDPALVGSFPYLVLIYSMPGAFHLYSSFKFPFSTHLLAHLLTWINSSHVLFLSFPTILSDSAIPASLMICHLLQGSMTESYGYSVGAMRCRGARRVCRNYHGHLEILEENRVRVLARKGRNSSRSSILKNLESHDIQAIHRVPCR